MKMRMLLLILVLTVVTQTSGQIRLKGYNQHKIDSGLYRNYWSAQWISFPGAILNTYSVYHFRKAFSLQDAYENFVIHVSADSRYKLYINGQLISSGPASGDLFNWNFETVDIAPYLKTGKNVLSAVVWNFGDANPVAQMSVGRPELIVQGNTDREKIVNTNGSWKCTLSRAYSAVAPQVIGYYVAGAGERFNADDYSWGWTFTDFDDEGWFNARPGLPGAMKGGADYPGRLLVPSPLPQMLREPMRLAAIRKQEGIALPSSFPAQKHTFSIPPNKKIHLVLDQTYLTTGYPELLFSKGKDAVIQIGYAESFYSNAETGTKGNRNEINGKKFVGYQDIIIADGGENRTYTPLWWRTWRYLDITIETKGEALIMEDLKAVFSAYPFQKRAAFECASHPELEKILNIGWRTAQLCAHETYMDCPYYEQLQYLGDTRIQAMITLYNTGQNELVKNALESGRRSMIADGITMSRYPTQTPQIIPSFSLLWIGMGHDYWRYRGDEQYLKTLLPSYRSVLAWFEQYLGKDYSLKDIPYWFFADWAKQFDRGVPPLEENGRSAFMDLLYLIALQEAAEMEAAFGYKDFASHYQVIIEGLKKNIVEKYWDKEQQMFADTYKHLSYSQHVNALAVLSGIIQKDKSRALMNRVLKDTAVTQVTIYFRYYLHQAMKKAGLGDELFDQLYIWKDQIDIGLTTWAETPEPSRSDCHAWGASPNIEFYRIILGIDTDAPGFRKVRISPSLGNIKMVSGEIPHPQGNICVSYKIKEKGRLRAEIKLPRSVTGVFVWNEKEYPLSGGSQVLQIDDK